MFLACGFRQRTVRVLYRGYSPFFFKCVYFSLLYPSSIFDMFIVVCGCVCVFVGVGVVWGFTNSFFFSLCMSAWLGDFLCVELCDAKFRGSSFPFFLCICIHMFTYVCVCVYIYIYMYVCV